MLKLISGSGTGWVAGQAPRTGLLMWLLWSGLSRFTPSQHCGKTTIWNSCAPTGQFWIVWPARFSDPMPMQAHLKGPSCARFFGAPGLMGGPAGRGSTAGGARGNHRADEVDGAGSAGDGGAVVGGRARRVGRRGRRRRGGRGRRLVGGGGRAHLSIGHCGGVLLLAAAASGDGGGRDQGE